MTTNYSNRTVRTIETEETIAGVVDGSFVQDFVDGASVIIKDPIFGSTRFDAFVKATSGSGTGGTLALKVAGDDFTKAHIISDAHFVGGRRNLEWMHMCRSAANAMVDLFTSVTKGAPGLHMKRTSFADLVKAEGVGYVRVDGGKMAATHVGGLLIHERAVKVVSFDGTVQETSYSDSAFTGWVELDWDGRKLVATRGYRSGTYADYVYVKKDEGGKETSHLSKDAEKALAVVRKHDYIDLVLMGYTLIAFVNFDDASNAHAAFGGKPFSYYSAILRDATDEIAENEKRMLERKTVRAEVFDAAKGMTAAVAISDDAFMNATVIVVDLNEEPKKRTMSEIVSEMQGAKPFILHFGVYPASISSMRIIGNQLAMPKAAHSRGTAFWMAETRK